MSEAHKHPKWQRLRLKILERDNWACTGCGDTETTLHVHHCLYRHDLPWMAKDDDLQTLCERCHEFLGEHPKAGVLWVRPDPKLPAVVEVMWCPKCGNDRFRDKGTYFKCASCAWRTDIYSDVGVNFSGFLLPEATESESKPKEYSLSWLTGMMTKVRKSCPSEERLFDALFPFVDCNVLFSELLELIKMLRHTQENGCVNVEDEVLLFSEIIRARGAIKARLKEATDGSRSK